MLLVINNKIKRTTKNSQFLYNAARIDIDVVIKLTKLYGVSLEYIFGLTEERIIPKTHIRI